MLAPLVVLLVAQLDTLGHWRARLRRPSGARARLLACALATGGQLLLAAGASAVVVVVAASASKRFCLLVALRGQLAGVYYLDHGGAVRFWLRRLASVAVGRGLAVCVVAWPPRLRVGAGGGR